VGIYIIRRLLWTILVVLGVAILIFTILYFIPGDPAKLMAGLEATPAMIAAKRAELGLDDPYIVRLGHFLSGVFLHFDFGESWRYHVPVTTELLNRFPRTLAITGICIFLQVFVGTPLGIIAAIKRNGWADRLSMFGAMFGISMPNFWIAAMLILLFSVKLGWLPALGLGGITYYILPCIANAFPGIATQARQTRSSMLDVIRSDYIATARAKGMSEMRIIYRHALPNAMLPVITIVGNGIAMMLAGTVVIEKIFSIPGVGQYLVDGIANRDYNVVQSSVIFLALALALIMLLVDLTYAFVDPRVKAQFAGKKWKWRRQHA
jgi:ABC-type dipeptide/oligopeptide/nickel transport system permease component